MTSVLKASGIPDTIEQYQLALDAAVAAGKVLGEHETLKRLSAGVSVEPVGAVLVKREDREGVVFYSSDMIPASDTIKDRFELVTVYSEAAIAAARVQENERCAKACESTSWSEDIDVWREMTKRDVSVKSMLACADAIRASIGETK